MSQAQSTAVTDYEPQQPCTTRVFVNGVRLPVGRFELQTRKEGDLDINRYCELEFASPFNGKDFLSLFDSLTDEPSQRDTVRVDVRNQMDEQYDTEFYGFVSGIGDGSSENRKIHELRARGPGLILNRIPAGTTFKAGLVDVETVVGYIIEELNGKLPTELTISDTRFEPSNQTVTVDTGGLFSAKSWTKNKHTISDVVGWLGDKLNARMWVEPTEDGGEFVVSSNPTKNSRSYKPHYLGGDLRVIKNKALKEIKPLNSIIVNTQAKSSLLEVGDFSLNVPADDFTSVKAVHKPLLKRNGGAELSDTVRKSDAETKQEAINEAKSRLKRRVDEATAGSIYVVLDKAVKPYETVTVFPTISGQRYTDVNPLEYEVSRSRIIVDPDSNEVPQIELTAGLKTDPEEDIEIADTWNQEAQ